MYRKISNTPKYIGFLIESLHFFFNSLGKNLRKFEIHEGHNWEKKIHWNLNWDGGYNLQPHSRLSLSVNWSCKIRPIKNCKKNMHYSCHWLINNAFFRILPFLFVNFLVILLITASLSLSPCLGNFIVMLLNMILQTWKKRLRGTHFSCL